MERRNFIVGWIYDWAEIFRCVLGVVYLVGDVDVEFIKVIGMVRSKIKCIFIWRDVRLVSGEVWVVVGKRNFFCLFIILINGWYGYV